jgi:hypothetical protein
MNRALRLMLVTALAVVMLAATVYVLKSMPAPTAAGATSADVGVASLGRK